MTMEQYLLLGLQVGAVSLLALMCYQDWQARSISWPAFPALGGVLLALRLLADPAALVGLQVVVNWGLLAVLVAMLALYVRLRFRGLRLGDCLGSGDVLYWAVAAVYLSPVTFWLYFLGSSAVGLAVGGLARWRQPEVAEAFRIPLAGVQAGCLLLLLALRGAAPAWTASWLGEDLLTVPTP